MVPLPDWATTERYDITAKPAPGSNPTREQRAEMMRNLLIERMKVAGHIEEREQTTLALVVARSDGRLGPELKKTYRAADAKLSRSRTTRGSLYRSLLLLPLACALQRNVGMRRILQAISISAFVIAFASTPHAQISFDVHLGTPPPAPRAYRVPPQPGPDYVWVEGYWYPANGQYRWHNGYWTRPPYADAYWVAPYYQGGQYYTGHWEGNRGDVHHDHGWDQSRQRDERWGYQSDSPRGTSGSYDRGRQPGSGSSGSYGQVTRDQAQAIVRSAYKNVLGREPDPASGGWVDRVFNDHWSQQQLENELRNSAEYRQKHSGR